MVKIVRNCQVLMIVIAVISSCYECNAQEENTKHKASFGISFSTLGYSDVLQFITEDGDPEYSGIFFYSPGLNCQFSISSSLKINASIIYGSYKIRITPSSPRYETYNNRIHLIYFPITLQKYFTKFFYSNGGILINFELWKRNQFYNQNGIGGTYGLGLEFDVDPNSNVSFFLNPYATIHSLINFKSLMLNDKLIEAGIKFGLNF